MLKLLGSLCVVSGSVLAWCIQRMERRRKRDTLSDFQAAFRKMEEEVRMARTPMPALLRMLAADCGPEAASFFRVTSKAAGEGEILPEVWRRQAEPLPLNKSDKAAIAGLGSDMQGDEEKVCKAVSHVSRVLERSALEAERKRPEEEKRSTALWFSAAALLVILLI